MGFCCFINGLLKELNKLKIGVKLENMQTEMICALAYADDIVLLAENDSDRQKLLDRTSQWCRDWRLQVKTNKTKVMHFRRKNTQCTNSAFTIGGQYLEIVDRYKYLGVTLIIYVTNHWFVNSCRLQALVHWDRLSEKTKSNYDLGYESYCTLVKTTVIPVMDYAIGSWFTGKGDACRKADQVLERAVRFYSGLPRNTLIIGMPGDFGLAPAVVRRDIETLHFYNSITRMESDRLTQAIFKRDLMLDGAWTKNLKHYFSVLEWKKIWIDWCLQTWEELKLLTESYVDVWKSEIQTKSKLNCW